MRARSRSGSPTAVILTFARRDKGRRERAAPAAPAEIIVFPGLSVAHLVRLAAPPQIARKTAPPGPTS
jgi:hypothetical protein